jgi:hypothetical protein
MRIRSVLEIDLAQAQVWWSSRAVPPVPGLVSARAGLGDPGNRIELL